MSKDVLKGRSIVGKNVFDTANQTIDDIKKSHSLVRYIEDRGVKLSKNGSSGQLKGLCPFHEDKNPSFSVNEVKGVFHCFGCGKSGTIIDAVSLFENVSTGEAIRMLSGSSGAIRPPRVAAKKPPAQVQPSLAEEPNTGELIDDVAPPSAEGASASPLITLNDVAQYYHKRLFDSKDAVQYLEKRGITDTALYERFAIGFADGSILSKLSDKQKEDLVVIGILHERNDGTYSEHFHNCIVFPITDDNDRVVGMYGRRITNDEPRHLYLPGPHRGVWNRKVAKVYDEIVIVESIIDALSLIQNGVENVQPLYGTNGLVAEHLQTLKDDNVKTVVLALDNDEAGRKATEIHKARLIDEGFAVKTIFPGMHGRAARGACDQPKSSKDWNEELLAGLDRETFKLLVGEAGEEKKQEPEKSFIITHEGIKDIFKAEHTCPEQGRGITYEIVGAKDIFVTNLRVNVKAIYGGESYYDNADLASGRSRRALSETLAQLFAIEYRIVERDLMCILDYYAELRDKKLAELNNVRRAVELTDEERAIGLAFLRNPDMFGEIIRDMDTLGYVGEDLNKLLLYLCASSRILDDPISVMILSQSASGKSMLVSTVEKLIPPEDVVSITSLSDQALNYFMSILHKFMNMGEAVHSETIEHQIRDMLSQHELVRHVVTKDEKTGKMGTEVKKTEAIVALVLTTTRQNINPENASRFFVINTDESREQTRRIHAVQREKYTLDRYRVNSEVIPRIIAKHHAAQRLLRKIAVVNDFNLYLDFPDTFMRVRRDHMRFIDLIACVCFLRQYQKELKHGSTSRLVSQSNHTTGSAFEYVECDIEDYRIAYDIMINGVLASTMFELPKATTELYEALRELAKTQAKKKNLKANEVTFTQREIREQTSFGQSWIRENLRKLVEYEYVSIQRSMKRGERGSYRIKDDAEIEKIDLSMIPTPTDMEKLISAKSAPIRASQVPGLEHP